MKFFILCLLAGLFFLKPSYGEDCADVKDYKLNEIKNIRKEVFKIYQLINSHEDGNNLNANLSNLIKGIKDILRKEILCFDQILISYFKNQKMTVKLLETVKELERVKYHEIERIGNQRLSNFHKTIPVSEIELREFVYQLAEIIHPRELGIIDDHEVKKIIEKSNVKIYFKPISFYPTSLAGYMRRDDAPVVIVYTLEAAKKLLKSSDFKHELQHVMDSSWAWNPLRLGVLREADQEKITHYLYHDIFQFMELTAYSYQDLQVDFVKEKINMYEYSTLYGRLFKEFHQQAEDLKKFLKYGEKLYPSYVEVEKDNKQAMIAIDEDALDLLKEKHGIIDNTGVNFIFMPFGLTRQISAQAHYMLNLVKEVEKVAHRFSLAPAVVFYHLSSNINALQGNFGAQYKPTLNSIKSSYLQTITNYQEVMKTTYSYVQQLSEYTQIVGGKLIGLPASFGVSSDAGYAKLSEEKKRAMSVAFKETMRKFRQQVLVATLRATSHTKSLYLGDDRCYNLIDLMDTK